VDAVTRDRLLRRLEALPDERVFQVLDYLEFLESRYGARASEPSVVQRVAEGVQDTLRSANVSPAVIADTMAAMTKAMGVLGGVAAAAQSVVSDVAKGATDAARAASAPPPGSGGPAAPPTGSDTPPRP
jgi:hypothetical protein